MFFGWGSKKKMRSKKMRRPFQLNRGKRVPKVVTRVYQQALPVPALPLHLQAADDGARPLAQEKVDVEARLAEMDEHRKIMAEREIMAERKSKRRLSPSPRSSPRLKARLSPQKKERDVVEENPNSLESKLAQLALFKLRHDEYEKQNGHVFPEENENDIVGYTANGRELTRKQWKEHKSYSPRPLTPRYNYTHHAAGGTRRRRKIR
jgi:hypothetical protein